MSQGEASLCLKVDGVLNISPF